MVRLRLRSACVDAAMLAILIAAALPLTPPVVDPRGAPMPAARATATAFVTGRILQGVTIDFQAASPEGALRKRATALLIDRQSVPAVLIDFP